MQSRKIKTPLRLALAVSLLAVVVPEFVHGADMGAGVNSAGVIDFPTSLDQTKQHTFQGTIHLVSIPDTDLQPSNFRYGLQLGNFQLLTDVHMNTVDDRSFNYGVIRAKLKVL
ncbi:MAG: hypothetical protein V3S29_04045, partial [bacterium]